MSKKPLAEIAKDMAGIDIAILSTHTDTPGIVLIKVKADRVT